MSENVQTHLSAGQLQVNRFETRADMGQAAAAQVVKRIQELLEKRDYINMIFAAAPSQNELLEALVQAEDVDWSRVNAFHMDEYIGLREDATQKFGYFLKEKIFSRLPFRSVNYLDGNADAEAECRRYTDLLQEFPTDIVCMGIGENCHIAFNDPHVADFNDPALVKVVDLDQACRQQQVNDGCFPVLGDVPTHALTLTIPALMKADYVYCVVPGVNKAQAVWHTLNEEIVPLYPSTVLRRHPAAKMFIDSQSASLLEKQS